MYSSYNIRIHFTLHAGFLHVSSRRSMIVLFDLYDKVQDVGSDVSSSRCNEIRHLILNYAPVSETTSITCSHIYIYDYILHIWFIKLFMYSICVCICVCRMYMSMYMLPYIYKYIHMHMHIYMKRKYTSFHLP